MKNCIYLSGSRESFPALLAILQKEEEKHVLILTESDKKAKIISRKLDLNAIKNSIYPVQKEIITVSSFLCFSDDTNVLVVYPTYFSSAEMLPVFYEKISHHCFKKMIVMLPEAYSSAVSDLAIPFDYYFIDENNLPSDHSNGLTFVLAD